VAKRRNSMPLTIDRQDTALAVVRLNPVRKQTPPATNDSNLSEHTVKDEVRSLIREHRLDEANRVVLTMLDERIAAGDGELSAASMLLQHYDVVLSRQPPLSHIGAMPLRPNDRLYACFDQFIDLIRQQQSQVSELQAIIAELI
jgi:hypothetical protein